MLEESFKKALEEMMGDYEYLESLVSSMPRMADVIERDESSRMVCSDFVQKNLRNKLFYSL